MAATRLSERAATGAQAVATVLALTSPLWFYPSGIAMWHVLPTTAHNMYWHYGIWPFYCFVVFVFAYQNGWIAKAISQPWLVYLGEISFSLYMIHQIVISNLMQNFGAGIWGSPLLGVLAALVVSIAMSALLFHTVEGPPRQWIKARLSGSERRPPLAQTAPAE